ncbi:thiazole synthase [bacterium]|nr:thiazole synthase [bacterium]
MATNLILNETEFTSRLLLGTGKFSSPEIMNKAILSSECNIVTAALRRVDLNNPDDSFNCITSNKTLTFLPNTSGARDATEAIRCAHLGRAGSGSEWVKLEVTPEPNYLLPDPVETYTAAKQLVSDGFNVLPYIHADPILALRLQDIGCAAVMPLAAPIGSNKGLETREFIEIIIEQCSVPVIVDAGLGAPSHAMHAMELGADAVLVNTAIATAQDPIRMAIAFKEAVITGRNAYVAGLPTQQKQAVASSPLTGFLH